jgi:hypothetical protein
VNQFPVTIDSNEITVVVPLDYALNKERSDISPASYATLMEARDFLQLHHKLPTPVVIYGNTNHPDNGMGYLTSLGYKMEAMSKIGLSHVCEIMFPTKATNSIDEAESIKERLEAFHAEGLRKGIVYRCENIYVFCDKYHKRRTEMIWGHVFRDIDVNIYLEDVSCPWGVEQAQTLQTNTILWAVANFVACIMMKLFGVESVRKIKQHS